jgi:hypothetical protein
MKYAYKFSVEKTEGKIINVLISAKMGSEH